MATLYFILGCTACGKGAVGRELARRLGGHVLSVDSMKVYRRMDIGTAKPSAAVRAVIPHHGIDLVEPWELFSVGQYVACADAALARIAEAGAVALAVGGTGLYVKALSEGLFAGPPADAAFREALALRGRQEGWAVLHRELAAVDPESAGRIHPNDEKRITRALEVHRATGEPISRLQKQWDVGRRRLDCVFVGLKRDKEDLHRRINLRAKRMVEAGLRDEVATLLADPRGLAPQAAQAVGYAEMIDHLRGRCTQDEAFEQIKINTRRLARKQQTWHRRFGDVRWFPIEPDEDERRVADRILGEVDFGKGGKP